MYHDKVFYLINKPINTLRNLRTINRCVSATY